MFEVAGIDHIVLRTTNLQAMLEFYTGILGCKVEQAYVLVSTNGCPLNSAGPAGCAVA